MLKVIKQYNFTCSECTCLVFGPAVDEEKTEDIEPVSTTVR